MGLFKVSSTPVETARYICCSLLKSACGLTIISVLPGLIVAVKPIGAPLMFCSVNIKSSLRSESVIAKSSAFRSGLFEMIVGQLFIAIPFELSSGEKVRIATSAVLNVIPVSGTTLFELSSIELLKSPTNTV